MARKIMVQRSGESSPAVLSEILAEDEAQLQEIMKLNPDLLPVDEFGMTGPLMIVGRETTLPSGYVDLVCLSQGGELLLVEFKTGPQNSDFRQVLAQLLDYGSNIWQMSYEEFESTIANRYFSSSHCRDEHLRGQPSLDEAARVVWPVLSEEEFSLLQETLTQRLSTGAFHYVVVAQRFTPTMARTVEYLNAVTYGARFYAVELVRFAADSISAFESRLVLKPELRNSRSEPETTDEARFLEQIEDDTYRQTIQELLEVCHGLGLRIGRGKRGLTIRLLASDRREPLTIAWLFPAGVSGWMGLIDLTLGFDSGAAAHTPSAALALDDYVKKIRDLPDVKPAKPEWATAYYLAPDGVVRNRHQIAEILPELVRKVGESEQ
jgi:hypothetical protein